jgi:hypothetical protein
MPGNEVFSAPLTSPTCTSEGTRPLMAVGDGSPYTVSTEHSSLAFAEWTVTTSAQTDH